MRLFPCFWSLEKIRRSSLLSISPMRFRVNFSRDWARRRLKSASAQYFLLPLFVSSVFLLDYNNSVFNFSDWRSKYCETSFGVYCWYSKWDSLLILEIEEYAEDPARFSFLITRGEMRLLASLIGEIVLWRFSLSELELFALVADLFIKLVGWDN